MVLLKVGFFEWLGLKSAPTLVVVTYMYAYTVKGYTTFV